MDEKFIEISNLYKTFYNKKQRIEVLKGIDLSVEKGEIYGIVGFSGAGKSTWCGVLTAWRSLTAGLLKSEIRRLLHLGRRP